MHDSCGGARVKGGTSTGVHKIPPRVTGQRHDWSLREAQHVEPQYYKEPVF